MTGGAGAGTTTVRVDARDQVFHRSLHDGPAERHLRLVLLAAVLDVLDFGHGRV